MTIAEILASATSRLADAGVSNPRREAASLLAFALDKPHSFLIAHSEYELVDNEQAAFDEFLCRRERREPFQYITGKQEFWGLEFKVAPGVLIPRPETEVLVESAIEVIGSREHPLFVEAGVGSGCISISILHSVPNATAIATDVSHKALEIAASNANILGVGNRLSLIQADLFSGVTGRPDLIVSNPPYIPDSDIVDLQAEVRDFEPRGALAGGEDGLDIVRRIERDARHILRSGGVLMLEIGAGQSQAVTAIFEGNTWEPPRFEYDLQSIPRVVVARLR